MTMPNPAVPMGVPGAPMAPTTQIGPAAYENLKARGQALAAGQPDYQEGGPEPGRPLMSYGQAAPPGGHEFNAQDRTMAREADEMAAGLRASYSSPPTPPPVAPPPPGGAPMQMYPPQVPGQPQPPQAPPHLQSQTYGILPNMAPPGYAPPPQPQGYQPQMLPQGQPFQGMPAMPPPPPQGVAPGSLTNPHFNPAAMPPAAPQDPGGAYNPQPPPQMQPVQPQGYPQPQGFSVPAPYVDPAAIQIGRNVEVMDVYNRLGYACDLVTKLYHELRQRAVHKNSPVLMKVNEFLGLNGRQALQ